MTGQAIVATIELPMEPIENHLLRDECATCGEHALATIDMSNDDDEHDVHVPYCGTHAAAAQDALHEQGLRPDEIERRTISFTKLIKNDLADLAGSSACDLAEEVLRAREKFPSNRFLLAALTEEVGELAKAYLQREGRDAIRKEALAVACVAMRIYEEGDAIFDSVTEAEAKK